MRKKALNLDTFREIKKSVSRFISIMLIISLGAGFFVGIKATAPSVFATAEKYFNSHNLMDFEILSTVGFNDKDIEAISAIDGVERIMPSYSIDLITENEKESGVVRVMSLPSDSKFDTVNVPELIEGRLPQNPDECVTIATDYLDHKYKIGDVIEFSNMAGTTEVGSVLTNTTYKVVGIINSPMYFSFYLGASSIGNGTLMSYAYIPASNFLYTRYTEAYVTLSCHDKNVSAFGDDYDNIIDDITAQLEKTGIERFDIFLEELNNQVADAEKELDDKSKLITNTKTELDDAKKQIEEGKTELASGWDEYNIKSADAKKQLDDAQKEIDSAKIEYADGEKTLAESRQKYEEAVAQAQNEFADARTELDSSSNKLAGSRSELDAGWTEYNDNLKKYEDGVAEFEKKKAEYDDSVVKLNEGIETYNTNKAQYDEKYALYTQGLADYNTGLKKYEDALAKYKQGESDFQKGLEEYNKNYNEYTAGLDKYNAGLKRYESSKTEYESGLNTYSEKSAEYNEAYKKYEAGLSEYYKGYTEYNNGITKLEDGKRQLAESKTQLAENKRLYAEGLAEYNAAEQRYNETPDFLKLIQTRNQLDEAKAQLDEADAQIKEAEAQIAAGEKEIANNEAQLTESKKTLDEAKTKLDSSKSELDAGAIQLAGGKKELDAAKIELDAGLKELQSSKAILDESLKKLEEAKKQIDDNQTVLTDSNNKLKELKNTLDNSKTELDAAKNELDKAKTQLDDGKKEIDANRTLINQGKAALDDGEAQLNESKKILDESKTTLDGYETKYNDSKVQLEDAEAQYSAKKAAADKELADSLEKIEQGQAELDDADEQIKQSETELLSAKSKAQAELDSAKSKLTDSDNQIKESQKKYDEGLIKYEDAVTKSEEAISDGQKRIQNARNDISDVESGKWYILNRDDIVVYYQNLSEDANNIDALAGVFPVFFLMIAALICLSTMSRMIDEQRTQIGTYKALGYSSGSIASKYIIYALTAGVSGSILGQSLGVMFLPRAIFGAYKKMYSFPVFVTVMPWSTGLAAFAVALLCTVAVAWFSCRNELRINTAKLMRPKTPKAGKTILLEKFKPMWKLFNFSQKITARNIFRSKVRMAMTIFGITGCMALVVTGFGLQDAISSIIGKQYGEIDKYDITISFTSDYTDEQANANRAEYLSDNRIDDLIFTRDMKVTAEKTKGSKSINGVSILIPQDTEQMQKMIILKDAYSGKNLTLDNNGVIITQKLAETLKLSAGDTLIIETENKQYPVTVSGIAEYYILHYIYMTPELYKDVFGSVVTYNTIFASKSDTLTDSDSFKTDWLNKNPDILVISMTKMISDVFDDVLNNLNAVIVIMILSAGALAFIVVFNLTNINISERVREIATIKVLGFKNFEVDMYIFKENIILGFAGIILGIIGGYYMTKYIVSTIEIEMLMFGRKTEISSYLYAALLTLIFTVFVNLVMSFRMKNISMVESLKAIE